MDEKNDAEQDDHWNDILNIAKSNKQNHQAPVTELRADKQAELDANVHAHIDQHFKELQLTDQQLNLSSNDQADPHITKEQDSRNDNFSENILVILNRLKEQFFGSGRAPALALVALMAITFGLLTSTREATDPFIEVPDSLFNAGLDKQLVLSSSGQRALTSSMSTRRRAFVSGTIRADLRVVQETNSPAVVNLIDNYPDYFGTDDKTTQAEKLALFQQQTRTLAKDEQHSHWLNEGYLLELIRLAALNALDTFEMAPLNTVLKHFKELEALENDIASSDGLNPNYIDNRKLVTDITLDNEFVPDDIQRVVDLTQSLQVLIQ